MFAAMCPLPCVQRHASCDLQSGINCVNWFYRVQLDNFYQMFSSFAWTVTVQKPFTFIQTSRGFCCCRRLAGCTSSVSELSLNEPGCQLCCCCLEDLVLLSLLQLPTFPRVPNLNTTCATLASNLYFRLCTTP